MILNLTCIIIIALVNDSHAQMQVNLNPHGNERACNACHQSAKTDRSDAPTFEQVDQICQSCHITSNTFHQLHFSGLLPNTMTNETWPSSFPRYQNQMTCLTCHDIRWQCQIQPQDTPNKYWLRQWEDNRELTLCQSCHSRNTHQRFNVHRQHRNGKPFIETCQWCHSDEDDIMACYQQGKQPALRANPTDLCVNCHRMAEDHPSGRPHVDSKLPDSMRWYMCAQEMKSTMCLPLKELKKYARATDRPLQSTPLDKRGRVTCVSCHNPHEKDLWPNTEIHARGSEPAQATGHRLRVGRGKQCLGCHEK